MSRTPLDCRVSHGPSHGCERGDPISKGQAQRKIRTGRKITVEGRIYAGSLHIRPSLRRKAFGTWRIGSIYQCPDCGPVKTKVISLAPKKAAGRNDSSEQRVELKSLGSHCPVITRRVSCFEGQKAPALRAPPSPALGLFFGRLIWRPHGVLAGFRSYWLDLIFRVVCFQAVGYPDSNSAPAFLCLGPVNPEALAHHTPGPFSWPPQLAASF